MEARKREVEEERAAAEAAQVRLMEQLSARQEAQVCDTVKCGAHGPVPSFMHRKLSVMYITISSCMRLSA